MYFHRTGAAANHGTDTISKKRISFVATSGAGSAARAAISFEGSFDGNSTHKYRLELEAEEIRKLINTLANVRNDETRKLLAQALEGSTRDLVRLVAISSGVPVTD